MKESLDRLFELQKKNIKLSPWVKKLSLYDATKELHGEVLEVLAALDNDDLENLKEEIGDVLADTFLLMVIANERKNIKPKEIIESVIKKLQTRKPFLVEEREVTIEEENKLWYEAKNKEKK